MDENASNLASYGLEPPRVRVTLTMADGKTHTLRIGEDTPTEGNSYAMLDGDKRLIVTGCVLFICRSMVWQRLS